LLRRIDRSSEKPMHMDSTNPVCLVLKRDWSLETADEIRSIDFFDPLFGDYRKTVNPARPDICGHTLVFPSAGEYYLRINETRFAKVLVIPAEECLSSSVLRVFDFCIANMCATGKDEERYAADPLATVADWFRNRSPLTLYCSSAHEVFRTILVNVFALPTRRVMLPGTGRINRKVYRVIHHVLEVYLPDLGKWVLFDLPNRFVIRWLDAFQIVDFVRQNTLQTPLGTGYVKSEALTSLDIYNGGVISLLPKGYDGNGDLGQGSTDLSGLPVSYNWVNIFKYYYGGVAYLGADSRVCECEPPNFWPSCVFASRHTDLKLHQVTLKWIEGNGCRVQVVSQEELQRRLNGAFRETVAAKSWLEK
jgi:hypothetical protein